MCLRQTETETETCPILVSWGSVQHQDKIKRFSGWSRARTAEPWNPEVFCSRSCFVPSFILLSLYVKLLFTNLHFSLQQIKPVSPLVHCTTAQMDGKRKKKWNISEAEDRRRTFTLKMNSLCEHNKYDSTQPIIHTVCSGFDSQRNPASGGGCKDSCCKLLFYVAVRFSSIRWQSLAIKSKRERYLDLNVRLSSIPVNMSGSCSTKQVQVSVRWVVDVWWCIMGIVWFRFGNALLDTCGGGGGGFEFIFCLKHEHTPLVFIHHHHHHRRCWGGAGAAAGCLC